MKMLTREEIARMEATALTALANEAAIEPERRYDGLKAGRALEVLRAAEYAAYRYGGK